MLKRIAVAALLAAGLSGAASATTVTYLFSGVVDSSTDLSSVPIGTPFTATLAIELATPGTSFPSAAATVYYGAVVSASFSIGSGSGATGVVEVYDSHFNLGDLIQFYGESPPGTLPPLIFSILLRDYEGTALSSQVLQVPTDLSQFELAQFRLFVSPSTASQHEFNGNITSIQLVPEPSLAALLGAGVLALALRRRTAA